MPINITIPDVGKDNYITPDTRKTPIGFSNYSRSKVVQLPASIPVRGYKPQASARYK